MIPGCSPLCPASLWLWGKILLFITSLFAICKTEGGDSRSEEEEVAEAGGRGWALATSSSTFSREFLNLLVLFEVLGHTGQ